MRPSAVILSVIAILQMNTPQLGAGSLEKAYFAATPPGAWAKYESSWEMAGGIAGANAYTYIRASDSDGRVQVETTTHVLAGPGEGVTTRQLFIMEPDFDLARDFMNRMSYLEASAAQSGEGPASLMQANVIEIMRASVGDLTNSVTFKGSKTIDGHECDHYVYSYSTGGSSVTHQEGEICLDEAVPFGVVFQKGRSTDQDGALISSYEQKLVESGAGSPAFSAGQPGDRGAVGGSFQLSVYEGSAVYQGSVDVGPLE